MMVMRNTIFLGSKKETAFPELSLISPRAGTILCFAQVSANMWVVARRLLYRVGIAWSRLSISKAVLEYLWLTTDILWQHLTCNQVSKVDIFFKPQPFSIFKLSQLAKDLFCNFRKFQQSNCEDQENAKSYVQNSLGVIFWTHWVTVHSPWDSQSTVTSMSKCFPHTLPLQTIRQCRWLHIIHCAFFEYWSEQTWTLQNAGVSYPFLLPTMPQKLNCPIHNERKAQDWQTEFSIL